MRLTEVVRSEAWAGADPQDGWVGLLAPTPVVIDGELFLVVGRRDERGASSLWTLHVRADLGDAELLPVRAEGEAPGHAAHGVVPTEAHWDAASGIVTVLFSGFRTLASGYQLLTGAMHSRSGDDMGWTVDAQPLLPPLPEQDVVRASATFSRAVPGTLVYAAGAQWVGIGNSRHPVSHLRRKPLQQPDDPGVELLLPDEDEFALTRPVEFVTEAGTLLFFSRRMRDGRYLQGLARGAGADRLVRCDHELHFVGGGGEATMYAYPFRWAGRALAAVATSRVGVGGIAIVELEEFA